MMASLVQSGLILGIESSCDETAAAVVRGGREVLSNVIATQVALHAAYGGVVPELASREHLKNMVPVVRAALQQANIRFQDLDAIAVTEGPGLAGALLVGILYAKALAFALEKPLIPVNHLEGHIHAVLIEAGLVPRDGPESPLLALVVSGGHTHLYLARSTEGTGVLSYRNVGRTVDDAAGEAYDKTAKLLGLGYPGGPWIDALSGHGDPNAVNFNFGVIRPRNPDAEMRGPRFDFSFSGIKTAVLRYVQAHAMGHGIEVRRRALAESPAGTRGSELGPEEAVALCDVKTLNLLASFQSAVVGNLLRQTFAAAEVFGARAILVSGGVAANRELRRQFLEEGMLRGLSVDFPSIALSTDNAAMIAAAAWPRFLAGQTAPEAMSAVPQLKLEALKPG